MGLKEEVWDVAKPHVKGLASDLSEKILLKVLDEVVAKSENKIDDGVWAVVKPMFLAELKNQISHI